MDRRRKWGGGTAWAVAVLGGLVGALPAAGQDPAPAAETAVVWLVRHAERADGGMADQPDPELSEAGRVRARELARFLGDAGVTSIHSTPFRRTRETAAPLALALDLEVESYDPRDAASMERFMDRIRTPGRHVVVGHSNTTPQMVAALGGDPVSPIDEAEYDRIYLVVLAADGSVTSTLLRFGAPAPGG